MRASLIASFTASVLLLAGTASAQTTAPEQPANAAGAEHHGVGPLAGIKFGGLLPVNGLGPGYQFGIEGGIILPALHRGLAIGVDVDYAQAFASSNATDPRVASNAYTWNLAQEFLTVMPVFMYRMTTLSKLIVPFVGVGPRIYFLRSTTSGQAGSSSIDPTTEVSTSIGFGVPFGAEIRLGPGGILAEFLGQWGLLQHTATGDSHDGAIGLSLGYRLAI